MQNAEKENFLHIYNSADHHNITITPVKLLEIVVPHE